MNENERKTPRAYSLRCKIRNDIILVLAVLALSLTVLLAFHFVGSSGSSVSILVDGDEIMRLSLLDDTEYRVSFAENPDFINKIVVENRTVYVSEANCKDGICREHRAISKAGDTIICLPHRLVVVIEK